MGGRFSKKKKGPSDEWRQIIPCASREPIESKYSIGEQIGKFADISPFILFFFPFQQSPHLSLHRGGFATVNKATRLSDGLVVAVKKVEKLLVGDYSDDIQCLRREIENMSKLDHINVLKLYEVFETRESVIMVIE